MQSWFLSIFLFFSWNRSIEPSLRIPSGEPRDQAEWNEQARNVLNDILATEPNLKKAKNVVMFVGDGMGISTVTASRVLKGQEKGFTGVEDNLTWDKFRHAALVKTYSIDTQTTGSAASATAFLGGVKTRRGVIGFDHGVTRDNCASEDQRKKVKSFLTEGGRQGRWVGVVTTTRVTHATPAAAYAHTAYRDWEGSAPEGCKDIAYQLVHNDHKIKLFLGGGRQMFLPKNVRDPDASLDANGTRVDDRNLIEEWKRKVGARGAFVWNKRQLEDINTDDFDALLGLFKPSHLSYDAKRTDAEPSLEEMLEKAIEFLKKKSGERGFLLLVEGGRIDHAHHSNQAQLSLRDTLAMDKAVEKALSMTGDETLTVVTADHSHVFVYSGYQTRDNGLFHMTNIPETSALGLDNAPFTSLLYGNGPGFRARSNETNAESESLDYRQTSAVPLESENHAAEDVAVYARGPFAHLFVGVIEQSVIPHAIAYAACIDFGGRKMADVPHCEGTSESRSMDAWSIAAIIIIVILVVVIILLLLWMFRFSRKNAGQFVTNAYYNNKGLDP